MRNPFKRLGNPYSRRTPEGEPLEGHPRSFLCNKLKILAGIVTFIVIVVVMAESVVIVQAGHRGVVLLSRCSRKSRPWRRSTLHCSIC
jgi:hypothetical protein